MYKNGEGKFADFHGLRHTFITNLGKAKVSPKVAQTLARHSDISLTMNVYTHIEEDEQIDAINSLPSIPNTKKSDGDGVCVPKYSSSQKKCNIGLDLIALKML